MQDRTSEWFVPKFGSRNFRVGVGILFLPYTCIVTCFAAWGSLGGEFSQERLFAICIIYFLSVGVSAHLLDAVGGKTRPWGTLPKKKMVVIALSALAVAFSIGIYYAFDFPLLIPIGIAEGFFLFAYNLELFRGRFHNNFFTVISWGILPVFAGSAIQTNSISSVTLILSGVSAAITYLLITISRKYKKLKTEKIDSKTTKNYELVLKFISLGVVSLTIIFVLLRL